MNVNNKDKVSILGGVTINEPFRRGVLAGFIGLLAINIVEFFLKLIKISETALWEAGGLVFLSEKALKTPLGTTIGILSHIFVGLIVGLLISYYIYSSGTKMAIWKGVTVSIIVLFIILGIVFPLRQLAPEMQDSPGDVLSAFIDHIVFGGVAGYIVSYYQNKARHSC